MNNLSHSGTQAFSKAEVAGGCYEVALGKHCSCRSECKVDFKKDF